VWTVLARHPFNFFLAFGVALSVGLAFTSPVTMTPLLTRWFVRRRRMALFFLSTGSMAGIAVMTPLLNWAIETVGWQSTLIGFAVAFTLVTVPVALFVVREDAPEHADLLPEQAAARRREAAAASQPAAPQLSAREAMRTAFFWKIALGLFACGYSMNLLGTH